MKNTTFIINPVADRGRSARHTSRIRQVLEKHPQAVVCKSEFAGHAFSLARESLERSRAVIACGGDGTAHEIANVLAFSDVSLGILPVGSANDFVKSLDHGFDRDYPVEAYLSGRTVQADLGSVSTGSGFNRYFLNSCGVGLTGRIARKVRQTKWIRGELMYIHALLSVLLGYDSPKMHIKLDTPEGTIVLDEKVFAFSVGNGRIEGGKFHIAPEARIDDGLLDVCILKDIPRARFFGFVLKYLKGEQIHDSRVLYKKARAVEIEIRHPEVMHLDGEVFDNVNGKVRIETVPSSINVLCREEDEHYGQKQR